MTTIIEDRDPVDTFPDTDTASLFDGAPARTADDPLVIDNAAQPGDADATEFTPVFLLDVAEIRDGQAVVNYAYTESLLAELRTLYEGKRYDLSIPEQATEAHDGSKKLMKLRTGLEKLRVAHKAPALELGTKIDAEAARIKKEIVALEKAIDDQIEAEKKRLAELEAERVRLAAERQAKFEGDIAGIRAYAEHAKGLTADRIQRGIDLVADMTFGDDWAEFGSAAALAQVETLKSMRELLSTALAREKAEAEAAAERDRLARIAEAQRLETERLTKLAESLAAQQAALDKMKADFEAREAAAEAVRVQALRDAEAKAQAEAKAKADAEAAAQAAVQAAADAEAKAIADAQAQVEADAQAQRALEAAALAPAPAPQAADDDRVELSDDALAAMPSIADQIPAVEPPSAAAPEIAAAVSIEAPAPAPTVQVVEELPPLSITAINDRLRVMSITAATLKALGFEPVPAKGSAVLLAGRDWAALKQSLINHIESLA